MDSNKPKKVCKLWVYAMKIDVSLRAKVVYARLHKYGHPVTARRLAELLGHLMKGSTVGEALLELAAHELVTRVPGGWQAKTLEEVKDKFRWANDKHPFYFAVSMPVDNPFAGRKNALELYVLYFYLAHLAKLQKWQNIAEIARELSVDWRTISNGLQTLHDLGLQTGRQVKERTWDLQTLDAVPVPKPSKPKTGCTDNLKEQIAQAERYLNLPDLELARMKEDAARTHSNNLRTGKYLGGSADRVYLHRLKRLLRERHAASQAVKTAQQEARDASMKKLMAVAPEPSREEVERKEVHEALMSRVQIAHKPAAREFLRDVDTVVIKEVIEAVRRVDVRHLTRDDLDALVNDPSSATSVKKMRTAIVQPAVSVVINEEVDDLDSIFA